MPTPNLIAKFLGCRDCIEEIVEHRAGTSSPKEYQRLAVGLTDSGKIQVWCNRHEKHVEFLSPELVKSIQEEKCEFCDGPDSHKH